MVIRHGSVSDGAGRATSSSRLTFANGPPVFAASVDVGIGVALSNVPRSTDTVTLAVGFSHTTATARSAARANVAVASSSKVSPERMSGFVIGYRLSLIGLFRAGGRADLLLDIDYRSSGYFGTRR